MATQQIDEYYESLAYWKQQALDYENQLRDIKCNTILNMAAEVEQLEKENAELKGRNDKLETQNEDLVFSRDSYIDETEQLKSKLKLAASLIKCNETFHRLGGIDDCEPCLFLKEIES